MRTNRDVIAALTSRAARVVCVAVAIVALLMLTLVTGATASAFEYASGDSEVRPGSTPGWAETSPGFVVPDDPLLREQWWLFNFGQEIGGLFEGKADADVRAPEAWAITTGSPDVVVAVLDFGIDYDHPEFDGQLWTNPGETGDGRESNGVDDDANGYVDDWRGWDFIDGDNDPMDMDGHGTAVAATVAARGGDGFGTTGIAPGARIMALRVGGERGVDQTLTAHAIDYAAAMGARIVVQSYVSEPSGIFADTDAETAAMLAHPELLFVAGSGNDGNDYRDFAGRSGGLKPCNNPDVANLVCVGGTTHRDEAWETSTFGTGRVQVAAPAESMLLASRPREILAEVDLGDARVWAEDAALDTPLWAAAGPPPSFEYGGGDGAEAGAGGLHVTHHPPEGTSSSAVLRLDDVIDLTGREGCQVNFSVQGSITGATVTLGLFAQSDERRNPFGGSLAITSTEVGDASDEPIQFAFPVVKPEPVELALLVETRQFGEQDVDVTLDDFNIDCWTSEHGLRDYAYWDGTSFATPLVAGIAALVASEHPELDPVQIRDSIVESTVALPTLDGLVQTGGRVDAYGALLRAAELDRGPGDGGATGTGAGDGASTHAQGVSEPAGNLSLNDLQIPGIGAVLGVPAGRGAPDPDAPAEQGDNAADSEGTSDGSGAPQTGSASAPPESGAADEAGESANDGDDSSSFPKVQIAVVGGVVVVTVAGVSYFYRRRKDGSPEIGVGDPDGWAAVKRDGALGIQREKVHRNQMATEREYEYEYDVAQRSVFLGSRRANLSYRAGLDTHASSTRHPGRPGYIETPGLEPEENFPGYGLFLDSFTGLRAGVDDKPAGVEAGGFAGTEVTGGFTFGEPNLKVNVNASGQVGAGATVYAGAYIDEDGVLKIGVKGSRAWGVGGGAGIEAEIETGLDSSFFEQSDGGTDG